MRIIPVSRISAALAILVSTGAGFAQSGNPADARAGAGGLTPDDLKGLVAPIALYPDVLLSQILPASTFPTDVVKAARWIREHPDLKDVDQQEWDLSVISVSHYPQVINKMNDDLDWTNALGAAFIEQPEDLMSAIQALRVQAKNAGVLTNTPQQTIVTEQEVIRIVPAEKEVVYVPQYNPQIVYVENDDDVSAASAAAASAISFGVGLALGAWLDNDCDWHHGGVVVCRPGYWGGWHYRGTVAVWDTHWAAVRGPRRGAVVWGSNGYAGAWRRPTTYGRPSFTGRYSQYNASVGNRRNIASGNQININRNNVNIDRGDRNTSIRGGDRANIGAGGNNIGGRDRANRPTTQPTARPRTRPAAERSPINDHRSRPEVNRAASRGAKSRGVTRHGGGGHRGPRRR